MNNAQITLLDQALADGTLKRIGRMLAGSGDDAEIVTLVHELAEADGTEVEYTTGIVAYRPSDAIWNYIS